MPLNKTALKNTILSILTSMEGKNTDAKEEFATELSNAIDTYIKTATITVPAGIPVTTPSGAGVTTAPATATIA